MKIAILGAGNGGKAAAADMALAGHNVHLFEFPQFEENIKPIRVEGGIHLVGVGRNGFARLDLVTTEIGKALEGVEIIVAITSAFAHKPLARICAPYLTDGQIVVLNPGSTLGSLEFLNTLKKNNIDAKIKIAEVHTLPYACRARDASVDIMLEVKKLWLAAFPSSDTADILAKFKELYPVTEAGKSIMDVGLNNGNPVAHPGPALLNAGRVEYSKGEYYHYNEGITPHVANVMQAIDNERMALCKKMDYPAITTVERLYLMGYGVTRSSLYEAYHTSPVFCGDHPIKGPFSVKDRYFVEDTMYGMVTWSSLGDIIDVPTPTIDAVVRLMSALHKKDYFELGERALDKFSLEGMNIAELTKFFQNGMKHQ